MSETHKPLRIAGHPVEVISLGTHSIGVIRTDKDLTVVFAIKNGSGSPSPADKCLMCRLSKLFECRDKVCPPIKKANPKASCSDAILACATRKCASCKGAASSGGDLIVIA
jgi:hypothetical protein